MKAVTTAILIVVAAGCTQLQEVRSSPPQTPSTMTSPSVVMKVKPDCGVIDVGSPRYGIRFHPTVVSAGDIVTVRGTTLRTEGGNFAPSFRAEIWWNTFVPLSIAAGATPVADGSPVLHLATVGDMDRCHFSTTFTVPDVPPGRYPVRVFVFEKGGYGISPPEHFTVRG